MEEWKQIPGYEGFYEASSLGKIRSVPRKTTHYTGKTIIRGGRILKGCVTLNGYCSVSLSVNGKTHAARVHSLIASVFIGERPNGNVVRHLDGNRLNNKATNIAYGTSAENMADAAAHGTLRSGENHNMAKLTEPQVIAIRKLHRVKTYKQIAEEFGISINQVNNIVNKKQWKNV